MNLPEVPQGKHTESPRGRGESLEEEYADFAKLTGGRRGDNFQD